MNKFILTFALFFISYFSVSQETYIVNNQSIELIKETNGSLNLLWNIIDKNYRYFVQKDNIISELVNTKDDDGKYINNYKTTLANLTSDKNLSTNKVKLTLISLKTFFNEYNALKDPNYTTDPKAKLLSRFSVFGGITNSPFIDNFDNIKNPVFGLEIEFTEAVELKRHSIYFQGKQTFGSDKFDYSATQIIVGYRFRIITKKTFNFYTSLDLARYAFVKAKYSESNDVNSDDYDKENGFEVPITFGFGADINLNNNSFLTISYNELFSILSDGYQSFPVSFTVGYKINL